ncbi:MULTISPECIES: hypothetical protein [Photorhabdus]|uniref:Photorhabdus luminescens subsp. laumondii TTO1 complete genome segment 6/17 n=1 Tax=Photorhabdus laumondii subsp. laumondii (strain DSM 15139 / CIP 105565 / TT01) TaxID=243265 RepID=Q7N674_PHOLL|nr:MULTISPECIES: hypothetical protein [Photorhabdus]AWK41533.1 hypothetical protein A4R40_08535 [Photorhabdus laumondii subsp. laumondii]KTL61422.1 hypothetical protein AA106_08865 [Photorhabdus laumondii subsp. laumondii]MCC8382157.1 hypothetical protein [Photorhabdus laumondii]MCC8390633.1 hypothetical protein [Photorhabdus laumondii]MCC8415367.1 hypothetical protein [Photorhabdus laumondii]
MPKLTELLSRFENPIQNQPNHISKKNPISNSKVLNNSEEKTAPLELKHDDSKIKSQVSIPNLVKKNEKPAASNTPNNSHEKVKAEDIFNRFKSKFDPYDRELPFDIMNKITNNEIKFSSEKSKDDYLAKVKDKKFTLRHYTAGTGQEKPTFDEISSNFNLVNKGIKTLNRTQGSNTNEDDWNRLGNTAFTFYLLAIDGEVSNRKFLSNTTHFAEINIEDSEELKELGLDQAEFFASPDLLHEKNLSQAPAVKGKLSDLKSLLLKRSGISSVQLGRLDAKAILKSIDNEFGNSLEIKIPGNVKVNKWNKI